MEVSTLHDDPF